MKFVNSLFAVLVIFSCSFINAQTPITANISTCYLADYQGLKLSTLNNPLLDSESSLLKDAPGQRMTRVGKTLTLAGSILVVGGIALMATADEIYYTSTTTPNGTVEEGDPQGGIGLVMTVGGIGMIIPGAIVWSKGKKKYRAYQSGGASLSLGVNKNGGGLRFRF